MSGTGIRSNPNTDHRSVCGGSVYLNTLRIRIPDSSGIWMVCFGQNRAFDYRTIPELDGMNKTTQIYPNGIHIGIQLLLQNLNGHFILWNGSKTAKDCLDKLSCIWMVRSFNYRNWNSLDFEFYVCWMHGFQIPTILDKKESGIWSNPDFGWPVL
jgi:hypothetical protein